MKKNILLISTFTTAFAVWVPNSILVIEVPHLYPEGVAYDESSRTFFVSSVTSGDIGIVDQNGIYSIFYKDANLKSTFGMKVYPERNRLWVCVSDPYYSDRSDSATGEKMARVIALDLQTAEKIADIDLSRLLPGKHFVNDLTIDNYGNIYVTDSYCPAIYRIDTTGAASVFVKHEEFISTGVGLNGIVFHPDGFLLVAHYAKGMLLKIPLDNPDQVSPVSCRVAFTGADGLLLDTKKNLVLVQNQGVDKVYRLVSRDRWRSAVVREMTADTEHFQNPTTATLVGDDVYVLNAHLDELSDSTKVPSKEFSIQIARFSNGRARREN